MPDLLVTTNGCDDPALGVTAWKVYAGNGAGFDDGVSWELPSTSLDASALPFASASASSTGQPCIDGTTGDWRFGLTDASGDGSADLLVTTNGCEDLTIGVNTWKIYEANCE